MTLELKKYSSWEPHKPNDYMLYGVKYIFRYPEYVKGNFTIVVNSTYIMPIKMFEYVRDIDTDKYYIKDGEWCGNDT
jgi:hypothetical protein